MNLTNITETIEGYRVKDLRWLSVDNIITGLVKDPVSGKPTLFDGFVACQWKANGKTTNKYKGIKELYLKINHV